MAITFENNPHETQFRLLKERFQRSRDLLHRCQQLLSGLPPETAIDWHAKETVQGEIEVYLRPDPLLPS